MTLKKTISKVLCIVYVFILQSTFWSYESRGNVLGDFQTFVPNTDGLFFITVDSGQTLKQNTIVGNLYLSYAKNYLLVYDNINSQNNLNYKDQVTSLDGTVGYSVSDNLQLFLGVTNLLDQSADSNQQTQYTLSEGVHSYRPGVKWKFSDDQKSQMALVASVDLLNVKNDPYTGENPQPIYNFGYAWSGRFNGAATHGFNLGYRIRKPGSVTPDSTFYPLKDQITFSYGYSYPWTAKLRYVFEAIGCLPVDKGQNKNATEISCLDLLGAARYRLNKTWAFVAGLTFEPGVETLSPDYRGFAGLNVYLYPQIGSLSQSIKNQINPLIVPEKAQIKTNESFTIPVKGGTEPYECKIIEGGENLISGPLNSVKNCIFIGSPASDIILVQVSDQSGQSKPIEITVTEAPVQISNLVLLPESARIYTGTAQAFSAEGGSPPYTYSILDANQNPNTLNSKELGKMNSKTGLFKASLNPNTITVVVTDILKNKATSTIQVIKPPKANQTITLKGVNFVFDKTELVQASKIKLEKAIAVLSKMQIKEIIVGGHTDDIGSADYNQDLSERRALTIAATLVERLGLSTDQVKAVGYGFTQPLVENLDDESRMTNRRVELSIYTK